MDSLHQYGLQVIAALQSLTWLELPMLAFTFLGTKEFFIFVLPVVYWCIDAAVGIRMAYILLIGTVLNETLKLAFQGPRPYLISTDIRALSSEATFGLPSGHAQTAAGIWGMLAATLRRRWLWIAAVILIFFIGVSRIYIGVHFPQDVLAGWLFGGLTLWAFIVVWGPVTAWLQHRSVAQQVLLSLALAALMILPAAALINGLSHYQMPAQWLLNAKRAGEPYPDPAGLDSTITPAAALCGFSLGLVLMKRSGGFQPAGPVWKRASSFIVGVIGIAILYLGLKALLPETGSLAGWSLRFLRYAILGFWVGAGAPWTFRLLKL